MFIEQAYSKRFDFIKYLPIPIIFLILMLLNFVATMLLPVDVDQLIGEEIARNLAFALAEELGDCSVVICAAS